MQADLRRRRSCSAISWMVTTNHLRRLEIADVAAADVDGEDDSIAGAACEEDSVQEADTCRRLREDVPEQMGEVGSILVANEVDNERDALVASDTEEEVEPLLGCKDLVANRCRQQQEPEQTAAAWFQNLVTIELVGQQQ